jgi:hypothetical protein
MRSGQQSRCWICGLCGVAQQEVLIASTVELNTKKKRFGEHTRPVCGAWRPRRAQVQLALFPCGTPASYTRGRVCSPSHAASFRSAFPSSVNARASLPATPRSPVPPRKRSFSSVLKEFWPRLSLPTMAFSTIFGYLFASSKGDRRGSLLPRAIDFGGTSVGESLKGEELWYPPGQGLDGQRNQCGHVRATVANRVSAALDVRRVHAAWPGRSSSLRKGQSRILSSKSK